MVRQDGKEVEGLTETKDEGQRQFADSNSNSTRLKHGGPRNLPKSAVGVLDSRARVVNARGSDVLFSVDLLEAESLAWESRDGIW